jgi:type I restriction enzyme S subunit
MFIGDIAEVKTGPFGSALHEKDYVSDGTPIITVEHLGDLGITYQNLPMVSDFDKNRLSAYSLKQGDVVFSRVGSVDRNAVISEYEQGWLFSGRLLRVRLLGEQKSSAYLSFHFHSEGFKRRVLNVAVGQTMASLNTEILKGISVIVPRDKEEQIEIAKVLSDVNKLILSLEKLIAKKRDIKAATMQQLLTGKKRLPGFGEGKGYKQTELGEFPEDWDIKKVKEFTDGTAGGTPSTQVSSYWGGEILWMSSGELHLKRVHDVEGRISQLGLSNSSTRLIPKDCVLIGLAGQGKTRGTVAINEVELCTNQSIAAIFPSDAHSTEYLFYNFDSRYDELRSLSTGDGGRGGLNLTILRNIQLPFPDKAEQIEIARVLADIDVEIAAIVDRLNKSKSIKQSMMQELLTGRTRLVDAAIQNEEERIRGT